MAEQSFRDQLQGFRWARGRTDDSSVAGNTSAAAAAEASSNPFSRLSNTLGISGYIPLRSNERTNEEEAYFALSRWERFLGFLCCCAGAAVCFFVAFLTIPMLAIKPRKFAVAFSLGSLLFMLGFAILAGPLAHLKHITSKERLPFTAAWLGSLVLTLFFAIGKKAYLATLICAIIQLAALVSYLVAYFPGGFTTLQFGGRMALRGAGNILPV
ncbi:SFT2-domain-containing protein [Cystobasidium minutum MCA 4210]|uniref:SFT2-domain-containing protein n=1 Tax=Cystobasidium minutum MCA 4210 TaxID=1397322 RepID=UPI0034CD8CEC|eukprot:jgi/Rhomi1/183975/fgenesh1_pm.5_\